MSGFNEESTQPEKAAGGDESTTVTEVRTDDVQPSVQATDRFGLEKAGKGFLTRKYDIKISAAGNPYFAPIESLLKAFVLDAEDALAEARARVTADSDLQDKATALAAGLIPYFEALLVHAGADREWLARSIAIWPLTDQVGFQLYKATSGEADLLDYATYLIRTDSNVESTADLDSHEGYGKRTFWTDVAYDELGVIDAVIADVDPDSVNYNLTAIIRSGYQSAANMDTRNHLRGVTGNAPATSDVDSNDIKSQILASRRAASQAA